MDARFPAVFSALRDILHRHAGALSVTADTPTLYRLEGGSHPTHRKPFPIAWVSVGKSYVGFHHMGIYARPDLLKGASNALKARMQGKSCFNLTPPIIKMGPARKVCGSPPHREKPISRSEFNGPR